jgi:hypothetical protein
MSNTLIAWAAFYPVLRAAFGARLGGCRKSFEGLNFPGFCPSCLAARQVDLVSRITARRAKNVTFHTDVLI